MKTFSKNYKKIDKCRSCSSNKIVSFLNLGFQPLANSLKQKKNLKESKYPLSLVFCNSCKLVQLKETVNKSILFKDYIWVTGTSKDTIKYLENLGKKIKNLGFLNSKTLITEIASNDGTFLKILKKMGYKNLIGVDPAINLAKKANKQGIKTIADFWSNSLAKKITSKYGKSDLIIARNVIPHVSGLLSVIKGIKKNLSSDGVGIIEFHDSSLILSELHYDSIYHEHLNYFSLYSIERLLLSNKLYPFHIEKSPISGGSLVLFFDNGIRNKTKKYLNKIDNDSRNKINDLNTWKKFAKEVKNHKIQINNFLNKRKNKIIIGFGSSARSQTFLNFCKITSRKISTIIDNNELKHNLYAPGSNIKVKKFTNKVLQNADYIFILAWNFKKEIMQQCKASKFSGKFLTAFPKKIKIIK